MTCGCPASDFNGNTIENNNGTDNDCISTLPTGAGQTSGPICIAADGTPIDQTTAENCAGASGTWYEHTGCGTCNQPNPMTSDQRDACIAEASPSTTNCPNHGSNCIYTANPGESPTCTVSDSGNIFSKNQETGLCEEKRCTCESDTGTYTEQRGIPNTGDACTETGLNSCQSCYDGFVSDPTNVRGHNECLLPSTEQTEGSFCWESEGILCADTYYCGNTQTLNFADGAKGMCLPKHQHDNMRGADAIAILDGDCDIEPTNNPYKPGFGHETSGDGVSPVHANLQQYMDSKSGCDHAERVTLSRDGTTGGTWDDGNNYSDGANTCTDGRECETGLCAPESTAGATLNCYQGPAGGIGSCCNPDFEADAYGYGTDATQEYTHKYYGTSPGDHPEAAPQRNRIIYNQWWVTHGETINRAMSGRG